MRIPILRPLVVLSALLALVLLTQFSPVAAQAKPFPDTLALPNGFQPEGIAIGKSSTFFVGSIPTGAIFQGDLRTGDGEILVEGAEGRAAVGLSYDRRTEFLFVAGGPTGKAFVYDTQTGDLLATFDFASDLAASHGTFINDVVVTGSGAYFTDSFNGSLYRVPLIAGGNLPTDNTFDTVDLGPGFTSAPNVFKANGIDAAPDGKYLVVVNSTDGALYRIEVASREITEIDLGGETVVNGDGILLDGQTLYVVRNMNNEVAVIQLSPDLTSGKVVDTIADPNFDVPTTIARFGDSLYVVNARFSTTPTADTTYSVVRVDRH